MGEQTRRVTKRELIKGYELCIHGFNRRKMRAYELTGLAWCLGIPSFPDLKERVAATYYNKQTGAQCIRYNPYLPPGELGFALAHEIAHPLMGHEPDPAKQSLKDEKDASLLAHLFRLPTKTLEEIYQKKGELNEEILYAHLGRCGMRPQVAKYLYKERVRIFLKFRNSHNDDIEEMMKE